MSQILPSNASKFTFNSIIALLFIICAAPMLAQAATITVGPAPGNQYQDLQLAINAAQPGDTIMLEAGASFTGSYTLRDKGSSTEWITIRSAQANLPPEGQRITPAYANALPKLIAPGQNQPALKTDPGAHHYRLIGIEILNPLVSNLEYVLENLVLLGTHENTQSNINDVPHHIVIDRCYLHGHPDGSLRRAIGLHSAHTDIINSYLSDCHLIGFDSQAIWGNNGPGPFKIINNYLEGAGENIMFGGEPTHILNLVPSDIEIRRNHFFKPLSWRVGDPTYAGKHWSVKNLFELKSARRVIVEGNIMENSWLDGQIGYAVLFTVAKQNPWATVEDVQFTNNIVRHAAFAIQFKSSGADGRVARITIRNNLFDDINGVTWYGPDPNAVTGHFLAPGGGVDDLVVDHNTVFHNGSATAAAGSPSVGFVFTNNLMAHNAYGVHGDGSVSGRGALDDYFPGWVFRGNLIAGANSNYYPNSPPTEINYYPGSINDALFVDRANGNYRLAANSPYKNLGTDEKDIGCDFDALNAAINGTQQTPYTGTSVVVPATIEAENFDNGGEGVAYHDQDGGNNGGVYRTTDVDIRTASTASNGHAVFNVYPDEWLEYSINVPTTGTYNLAASVASRLAGGTFHFKVDGVNVTGPLQAPTTGSWYTFQSVSKNGVSLAAGTHVLRLVLDTPGVEGVVADFDTLSITPVSTPYTGAPVALPGAIPVENFDNGGEGLAYHDLTPGNSSSSSYRTTDVDMYGDTVLSLQTGEWLKYTVDVGATAGTYAVVAQTGADTAGGTFHVEVDGVNVTGTMSLPHTGSWSSWQSSIKTGVSLTAGQRVLRIVIDNGVGFNSFKSLRIVNTATPLTPFNGTPAALPGTIAAAAFDNGGEGVAYHDITPGCTGYCPSRNTDVDTYGNIVFRSFGGEWLKYTVNIAATGTYTLMVDIGATVNGQTFHVEFDGTDVTGPMTIPNTGSWSTFQTVTKTGVSLSSGQKVMRVVIDGNSPDDGGSGVSLNTIRLQ